LRISLCNPYLAPHHLPSFPTRRSSDLTVIAGNGLFKPNISAMVGKLYAPTDERRDSGFTLFYMGINAGAFIAPLITGWLSDKVFGTDAMPARSEERRVGKAGGARGAED